MVRPPEPAPKRANLSPSQIQQGIDRINRSIEDLEKFDPQEVERRWSPEVTALEISIDETLTRTFGKGEHERYASAARLDRGLLIMGNGDTPIDEVRHYLREAKENSLALLRQVVRGLEEELAEKSAVATHSQTVPVARAQLSNQVFIVHGQDSAAKTEVARVIERAGLDAIILHEQPNQGRTIIEKFEDHSGAASFAVIVLTPDDVRGCDTSLKGRARQNVIGEMFWFAGRLGRKRVCALRKGDIEVPSDFAGIVYTDIDDRGAWKAELLRQLAAAGYKVDWLKAMT